MKGGERERERHQCHSHAELFVSSEQRGRCPNSRLGIGVVVVVVDRDNSVVITHDLARRLRQANKFLQLGRKDPRRPIWKMEKLLLSSDVFPLSRIERRGEVIIRYRILQKRYLFISRANAHTLSRAHARFYRFAIFFYDSPYCAFLLFDTIHVYTHVCVCCQNKHFSYTIYPWDPDLLSSMSKVRGAIKVFAKFLHSTEFDNSSRIRVSRCT